jgi:hypothetical protein
MGSVLDTFREGDLSLDPFSIIPPIGPIYPPGVPSQLNSDVEGFAAYFQNLNVETQMLFKGVSVVNPITLWGTGSNATPTSLAGANVNTTLGNNWVANGQPNATMPISNFGIALPDQAIYAAFLWWLTVIVSAATSPATGTPFTIRLTGNLSPILSGSFNNTWIATALGDTVNGVVVPIVAFGLMDKSATPGYFINPTLNHSLAGALSVTARQMFMVLNGLPILK